MSGRTESPDLRRLEERAQRPHPEHTPGRRHHYTPVGITFHWLMAGLIVLQLWLGWRTTWLPAGYDKADAYQLHAELGLMILVLASLRLTWRIFVRGPEETVDLPAWQYWASRSTYWLLYTLMFALPLSGWLMISATARERPVLLFGRVRWPHMPFLEEAPLAVRARWEELGENVHEFFVWSLLLLLALHIAAALKHHFINRDEVLSRMIPWLGRRGAATEDPAPDPPRARDAPRPDNRPGPASRGA